MELVGSVWQMQVLIQMDHSFSSLSQKHLGLMADILCLGKFLKEWYALFLIVSLYVYIDNKFKVVMLNI